MCAVSKVFFCHSNKRLMDFIRMQCFNVVFDTEEALAVSFILGSCWLVTAMWRKCCKGSQIENSFVKSALDNAVIVDQVDIKGLK